jgi:hypothetical protein
MLESILPRLTHLLPVVFLAGLGFLLGPKLKLRRITAACLAPLLVILVDGVSFVTTGTSPWRWVLLPPAVLWLRPWLVTPWMLYRAPLPQRPPQAEPFDPARHPLADATRAWMEQTVAVLRGEGFTQVDDVTARLEGSKEAARVILMDLPAEATRAVIHSGTPRHQPRPQSLGLSTVLGDGRTLTVLNALRPPLHPRSPDAVGAPMPEVTGTADLLAVFRALVRETGGDEPRSLPPGVDARSSFEANFRKHVEQMLAAGWYRRVDGEHRLSLRGAAITAWSMFFPLRQMAVTARRDEQDRVLRRLGLPLPRRGKDPSPLRWWTAFGGLQAAGAVALLALGVAWPALAARGGLGSPIPGIARTDTVIPARLPRDFAVPADFPGAVAALERLAGARAKPLTADDGLYGQRTNAMAVPIAKRRIDPLLAAAQPAFLARGFVLFHTQEFSGVHGEPEALALFPSRDPIDAVVKMNTNGDNHGIGTGEVAAWLREVGREHPFRLTSAGFDFVEGRFTRPLSPDEAQALAARVARFCPDVVSQGTGTEAALAREMRRTRTLYCWWDY